VSDTVKLAMEQARKALEYSNQCLSGVISLDDEDEGKDGGSATCQDCIKINNRAIKSIERALQDADHV